MAQLVKLLDYISRYENDLTRYPTQFIRLKRSQWKRMKIQWEKGSEHSMWETEIEDTGPVAKKNLKTLLRKFSIRKDNTDEELDASLAIKSEDEFSFDSTIIYTPKTEEQLRKLYLDHLFHFQLKWASSTLIDKSKVDVKFMHDSLLRSLTQQLPDSFLLFYNPILKLKKAPIELDIIIVTPVECMCISVLEKEDLAAYIGSGDRFWTKKTGENELKLLNPLISLNRNEKIISKILYDKGIDFPIRKYLISRNGYIDCPNTAFDVKIIDKRNYASWFSSLTRFSTPLKLTQFKTAQALLDVGQTTAMSRFFEFDDSKEGNNPIE